MSEYDLELAHEILQQILWSAQTIAKRFEPITSPDDFIASEEGLEKIVKQMREDLEDSE
jgi:hypothetical protein